MFILFLLQIYSYAIRAHSADYSLQVDPKKDLFSVPNNPGEFILCSMLDEKKERHKAIKIECAVDSIVQNTKYQTPLFVISAFIGGDRTWA